MLGSINRRCEISWVLSPFYDCDIFNKLTLHQKMQLLVQALLVLSIFISYRCIYAEDADHVSANIQDLIVQHEDVNQELLDFIVQNEDIHQEPLPSTQPHIPFTGNVPLTADRLIELVRKDYADPLPNNLRPRQILDDVRGTLNGWEKSALLSWIFRVDVRFPWQMTYRPVIWGVKRLAQGIACGNQNGCSVTVRFSVLET